MTTLTEAIMGRRSIRKFKGDPIPRETLLEVLDQARWAPSWGNTQPWGFHVVTGNPLMQFKKAVVENMAKGEAYCPDIPMPETWPDDLKKRYGEVGKAVLSSLSIAREDKESRDQFYSEMALLFGAPCLIIGSIPRGVRIEYAMLDMGLIIQTICLAAVDKGLGSCIMAASVGYPALLRRIGSIPDDRLITMGVAIGYPDLNHPVNQFPRPRMEMAEMIQWVG